MEPSVGVEFGHGWVWEAGCCFQGVWEGDGKSGTHKRWLLTGTHAPYCEEGGMVEETRIIFPRESKLGVGGNAGCSELQHLNRSASSGPTGKALMASGRWRVK